LTFTIKVIKNVVRKSYSLTTCEKISNNKSINSICNWKIDIAMLSKDATVLGSLEVEYSFYYLKKLKLKNFLQLV